MKVLIADDSAVMRKTIKSVLSRMGYDDVIEAANGREALDALNMSDGVDLVLVDWNMPVMTGIEFVQAARSRKKYRDLVIIMVTSNLSKSDISRALLAGVDNYIAKPFTPRVLDSKIRQSIEKKKSNA